MALYLLHGSSITLLNSSHHNNLMTSRIVACAAIALFMALHDACSLVARGNTILAEFTESNGARTVLAIY